MTFLAKSASHHADVSFAPRLTSSRMSDAAYVAEGTLIDIIDESWRAEVLPIEGTPQSHYCQAGGSTLEPRTAGR